MKNKLLVIAITGQEGSIMPELLLAKEDGVHGIVRRASTSSGGRLDDSYSDPHETRTCVVLGFDMELARQQRTLAKASHQVALRGAMHA